VLVACIAAVSSSCREPQPSGPAATTAVTTTIAPQPTAPPSPASRADLMGPTAPLLLELGGRYLCDQRVYPAGAGPHISAWEWAFDDDPGVLTEKLAKRLSDAEREE
jgi:hypothetical protein